MEPTQPNPNIGLFNRQKIIILTVLMFTVLIIVVTIFMSVSHNHTTKPSPTPTSSSTDKQSVDKTTHETVSNPSNRTAETYGNGPDTPLYLGFADLLTYGTSSEQLDSMKRSFYAYSMTLPKHIKKISLDPNTINHVHNRNTGADSMSYEVVFDDNTYVLAKFIPSNLSSGRLYLSNPKTNAIIYDSGPLDSRD